MFYITISKDKQLIINNHNNNMNLRDLIYSYNSNIESNTEDELNYKSNKNNNAKIIKPEDGDDFDHDSDINIYNKRQRLCKHMSSIPVFKNNTKVDNKYKLFYENTPEIASRAKISKKPIDNELRPPGLSSCLKFQQNHKPLLTTQREIVRNILTTTYHAKDYEIANNAIKLLSQIDSIEVFELKLFGEMLRYSKNSSSLIKKLLKNSIRQKLVKSAEVERKLLLEMFLELLLSNGDIFTIRLFLQNRLTDSAYYNNYHLINMHVVVLVIEIIEFTREVITSFNITTIIFPTLEEIINYPLQFYKIITLVYNLMTCNSNNKLFSEKYKRDSKQYIDEISKLYQFVLKPPKHTLIPIDIMEIYVSFFQATKNEFEIYRIFEFQETLIKCKEELLISCDINNNKSIVLCNYYKVIIRCFTQLELNYSENGNTNNSNNNDLIKDQNTPYLTSLFIKWLENEDKLSSKYVYSIVCLDHPCLSKNQLIKFIIASLESINSFKNCETHSNLHNIKFYLLWRKLANVLGPINNCYSSMEIINIMKSHYNKNKLFWNICFSLQTIDFNSFDLIPLSNLDITSVSSGNLINRVNHMNTLNDIEYSPKTVNNAQTSLPIFTKEFFSLFNISSDVNNIFTIPTRNIYSVIDNMESLQLFDNELFDFMNLVCCTDNSVNFEVQKRSISINILSTKYYNTLESNDNREFCFLSDQLLELLTYKVIVCSHIYCDNIYSNLFILKSLQIIIFHYHFNTSKVCALNCLIYLEHYNIDIFRGTNCFIKSRLYD